MPHLYVAEVQNDVPLRAQDELVSFPTRIPKQQRFPYRDAHLNLLLLIREDLRMAEARIALHRMPVHPVRASLEQVHIRPLQNQGRQLPLPVHLESHLVRTWLHGSLPCIQFLFLFIYGSLHRAWSVPAQGARAFYFPPEVSHLAVGIEIPRIVHKGAPRLRLRFLPQLQPSRQLSGVPHISRVPRFLFRFLNHFTEWVQQRVILLS